jgi:hypothetical protein
VRVQVKLPSVLDQRVLQEAPLLIVSGPEMQNPVAALSFCAAPQFDESHFGRAVIANGEPGAAGTSAGISLH